MQKSNFLKCILFLIVFGGAIFFAPSSYNASNENQEISDFNADEGRIVYVTFGGANNPKNQQFYRVGDDPILLRAPHRFGFTFKGWYFDQHYTKKVKIIHCNQAMNLVLYARWDANIDNYANVNEYPYTKSFGKTGRGAKKLLLKNMIFDFVEKLQIPGMPSTKETDLLSSMISSTSQLPQGFCFTEDYVLITAYSTEENATGSLMVFDRDNYRYLATLAMDPQSHLGGVTYDGTNVWVCNSEKMTIERISIDFVDLLVNKNKGEVVDASEVVDSYKVKNIPSCITYYDGRIWVGTHRVVMNGKVVSYYYDDVENKLYKMGGYVLPPKVQGIAFDEDGHVYLSTSYGRNSSSYLKIYKNIAELSSTPTRPDAVVEMPPGSEELDMDSENNLYIIFETAGEKYYLGTDGKGVAEYPLDELLVISDIEGQIYP